jgi:putative endonuclease
VEAKPRRRESTRARGTAGEDRAATYLAGKGYEILARNFRSRRGEVDIVARRGDTVAFVEVKCWGVFGQGDLEYSVGGGKQRRIVAAARWFLARRAEGAGKRLRFDVILVPGGSGEIRHIEDAFAVERGTSGTDSQED